MIGRTHRNEDGFSLVEILIVFVLIGVALMPLAGVQLNSRRTVHDSMRYGTAVQLAQNELEKLRAAGFGTAVADSTRNGNFTIVTTVTPEINPLTGLPSNELERLSVSVLWQEDDGQRSVVLTGLRANR